jgi:hypothetical protein
MRRRTNTAIRTLVLGLTVVALGGWAGASQIAKLTINGSVSYETDAALPSDSRMLVGGAAYVARASIVSDKRAIFASDDVKIDVAPPTVDAKEIALKPVK